MSDRAALALCVGVVLVVLAVYGATLAPGLTWAHHGSDGGDFVTAAVTGRLAHPPGFPVYSLLARVFVRLPWRDPAWRLNVLSAVMAAGTVALVALTLWRRGRHPWAVLVASLTLAVSPLFWSQALITEVYTTATFFVAGALCCSVRRTGVRRARTWFWLGVLWGLGCAVHWTVVFFAPLWLAVFWADRGDVSFLRGALLLGGGWLVGVLPYAWLPFSGSWPQPWGDMRTLSGWWNVVSARIYWGYALGLPPADWGRRTLSWATLLARQFTPLGGVLALWGVSLRWQERRWETAGALATLSLGSLYAITYNAPDSWVYLLPLMPLLALWLGDALSEMHVRHFPRWAWILLPLVLVLWNGRAMDLHRDDAAMVWLARVMEQMPARAVVLTRGDKQTFAFWYAQSALGMRPDILPVDADLWYEEPYRVFIGAQAGVDAASPEDLVAGGRPLCELDGEEVVCR